ncbi:MCE family protein [Mycolicibacterium sp.]|uniref:MCE family protein n=1 Tax=Mycolicibacterium sp. TaxID=2320850 RepID=UPI00355FB0C6
MILDRRIKIQLTLFTIIAAVAGSIIVFGYMKAPALLFGVNRYTVTVELTRAAGLYPTGNVTYRGTEVGRIIDVNLTDTGVEAVLSLNSKFKVPSDLDAEVHSQSAIGEQYVALLPRDGDSPPLKDGDIIPADRTSAPPDINDLLDAADRGLQAIPQDNLRTVIDESYIAVGGLGPELSRLVNSSTKLATDARRHLDPWMSLIDQAQPVLDSQANSAGAIRRWASQLATVSTQLEDQDGAVAEFLDNGSAAAAEARQLFERVQPTLPVLLSNLVSVGEVAVVYQPAIEQLLVLLPQGTALMQGAGIMNRDTKQDFTGVQLDFNLNLNMPPPCVTGFLPAQQQRTPSEVDFPDRPEGDLYCRIPQDAPFTAVRGARNYPCLTRPGKRAPTVEMCESDEEYVPLNDGYSWKGDPNATLSGQDIPQLSPEVPAAPPPPPIATAVYDPATGTYVGPDGKKYTQSDLARPAQKDQTWQTMLVPPSN